MYIYIKHSPLLYRHITINVTRTMAISIATQIAAQISIIKNPPDLDAVII